MASSIETQVQCDRCKTKNTVIMMVSASVGTEQFNKTCEQCGAILVIQVVIKVRVIETKWSRGAI
jgi:transcription elongation factor Elf1